MIPDGQNLHHSVSGYSFVYRPLPACVRSALWKELLDLPERLFRIAVHQISDRQIVTADWNGGTETLDPKVFDEIFRVISSPTEHEANLYRGAVLASEYPHLAETSCGSCKAWLWNPLTGELFRDREGNPIRRETGLLCETPEGCPKGTPDDPIEFTPTNAAAYRHFQMAEGQGCPDDHLVRRNWAIISQAKEHARKLRERRLRQHPLTHGRTTGGSSRRPRVHAGHV